MNYRGEPVDLAEFKRKAVLVTLIYTHSPTIVDSCRIGHALLPPEPR